MPTYGDVRTKFIDRMKRRDMTTTLADGFLTDAIKRIQRILRVGAQEKYIDVTLTNDSYFTNNKLLIPVDYLALKHIRFNNKTILANESLDYVARLNANVTGDPTCFARETNGWVLAPFPQASTTVTSQSGVTVASFVRIAYYAEFPSEALVTDDMILSDIADDAMIFGALSYACDHFNDVRGDRFEQRFTQIMSDIQEQANTDELRNARVAMAYTFPDDVDGL